MGVCKYLRDLGLRHSLKLCLLCSIFGNGQLPSVLDDEPPTLLKAPFSEKEAIDKREEWARHLKSDSVVTNSLGQKLILIPPGVYTMGSPFARTEAAEVNRPYRVVTLTRPFLMGTTEVTQGQWKALMNTEPWAGREYVKEGPDYAACYLSSDDCVAFITKLNAKEKTKAYRLPTEAEWEYAARAGTTTLQYWGEDESKISDHAWWGGGNEFSGNARSEQYAHEVGKKLPNPFGLFDIYGNVTEGCSDWFEPYDVSGKPLTDPMGPKNGDQKVSRGGDWIGSAKHSSASVRHWIEPDFRDLTGGFRIVRGFEK
jgi:formylglycine-generating enzyme